MGSKGGGSQDSTQTVYQSSLPKYAQPYYESLMERAQEESTRPYQPYGGQRLAGMHADTGTGLNMAENFAQSGLGGLATAMGQNQNIYDAAMGLQNYQPGAVTNTYTGPAAWTNGQFAADQVTADTFDAADRDQYMSPYMDAVVAASQRDAQQKALEEQAWLGGEAAQAGAFGGSRAAVRNQMALNQAQQRISDIGVQGRQAAFENAQQQYERDQARNMTAQQLNQAKNLEALGMGEQSRQFGFETTEQLKAKAAELGMTAQELTEKLRQSGKQLGLQGLQVAQAGAGQLADMQQQLDDMTLARIQAQLGVGTTREDYQQEQYDLNFEDYINQRDATRQNLGWMSGMLQGLPVSGQTGTQITTGPAGNPLAGAVGTAYGIQALQNMGR